MRTLFHAIAAATLIAQWPVPAAADPVRIGAEHCVVAVRSDDTLNLRSGPGTRHRVLAKLPYAGCAIIPTGPCSGSWCPVEADHHAGWVHRRHIAPVSAPTHCLGAMANPHAAVLRAWPSDRSRELTRLQPRSCGVALLPFTVGGWQKIRQGGWEGWVRLSDLLVVDG